MIDLRAAWAISNVKAFARVVREKESGQTDDAYTILNGGSHFFSFAQHPYKGQRTPPGKAAGAYQFIASTWGDVEQLYALPDFSPDSQDLGFVARLVYRGALDDVIAGRFDDAVARCRLEWTSLPGASESSGAWTLAKARDLFRFYGGGLSQKPAPTVPIETAPTQEHPMPFLALLSAFGPIIAQLIPQVAKAVGGGERAQQNVAAAQAIFDTVVKASGQPNIQSAVEAMQTDPTLVTKVTEAVVTDPAVMGLLEIGGGIKEARAADAVATQAEKPFWYSPAFWITVLVIMPPVDFMVFMIVWQMKTPSENLITQIVTAMLAILAAAAAFYFGTTMASQKKDQIIAERK